jgi:hypothetical protein
MAAFEGDCSAAGVTAREDTIGSSDSASSAFIRNTRNWMATGATSSSLKDCWADDPRFSSFPQKRFVLLTLVLADILHRLR